MKNLIILTLSILSLKAFAQPQMEPLLGSFSTLSGIHIQVRSGGCTWKEQFHPKIETVGDIHRITFVRSEEDSCLANIPYGEILTFSFEELGLKSEDRFLIMNPTSLGRVHAF